jgi:hypothetical protein
MVALAQALSDRQLHSESWADRQRARWHAGELSADEITDLLLFEAGHADAMLQPPPRAGREGVRGRYKTLDTSGERKSFFAKYPENKTGIQRSDTKCISPFSPISRRKGEGAFFAPSLPEGVETMTHRLKLAPPAAPTAQTDATAPPETAEAAERTGIVEGQGMGAAPGTNILYRVTQKAYPAPQVRSINIVLDKQKILDREQNQDQLVGLPTHLSEEVVDRIWAKLCRTLRGYKTSDLLHAIALLDQADLEVPSFTFEL